DGNSGFQRSSQLNSNFQVIKDPTNDLRTTYDQTLTQKQCQDNDPSCPLWGSQGECYSNPDYMVPNCAYTCNTCHIGVRHNNGVRGFSNSQFELNIITRENSTTIRNGIMREAGFVFTTTVETVDLSANDALNTTDGAQVGKEILMLAAESVASSAREYAMGCRDLTAVCQTLAAQGNCTSHPAFMLVNCPISCDSCLPRNSSECENKGDDESCELSAVLGLCEVNYSYNLRFCSGSCKTTQSLKNKCKQEQEISSCTGLRSLRTPQFTCGIPIARRKR
ncbi:unnamed protein product, partial [Meganyctiphanes norvegica]